ncbi:MAG: response regulator transcription factor [Candidatus Melainabacteria bacterium]|nr:response regulator transcription factor [Candidatus Melainabacteria bacterium]
MNDLQTKDTFVVVDDHPPIRSFSRRILEENFPSCNVLEAETGSRAIELSLKNKPALVIMDIAMPDLDGIEATQKIVQSLPQTGVVIYSNYGDEVYVRKIRQTVPVDRAFAYVLKTATQEQFTQAIKQVYSGEVWLHPDVQQVVWKLNSNKRSTQLTEIQHKILTAVSIGKTNDWIAEKLYMSNKTIQYHLYSIYDKLGINSAAKKVNPRNEVVCVSLLKGLIDHQDLKEAYEKENH